MPADPKKSVALFEQEAKPRRAHWENHWQEVADLVLPTRDFTAQRQKGTQRRVQIYDDTAPVSADVLASAIHALFLNPAARSFVYATDVEDKMLDRDALVYLDTATRLAHEWMNSVPSGAAVSTYEVAQDLVVFGTGIEMVMENGNGLRFQARSLADYYLLDDDDGRITHEFRMAEMSARDMLVRFGRDRLDPKIRREAEKPQPGEENAKHKVLHHIYPRDDRDPTRRDGPNKPFASLYIDLERKEMIRESGFDEDPYLTPRWSRAPEEIYGRSPAMAALPAIKGANAIARTVLQATELAVNPPIVSFDNLKEGVIRTTPGARIYLRAGSRDVPKALEHGANVSVGEAKLAREREIIEQAFYIDRLKLPSAEGERGHPRMTATEIIERRQENLLVLSPIVSRLHQEWAEPRALRTFRWLRRSRRLGPPPESLMGRPLRVRYVSPMALAQRASEIQSFLSAIRSAGDIIAADPAVLDNLDRDEAFRGLYEFNHAPPQFLRPKRVVERLRQERAEAEAAAQQLAATQAAASAGRDIAAGVKDFAGAAA